MPCSPDVILSIIHVMYTEVTKYEQGIILGGRGGHMHAHTHKQHTTLQLQYTQCPHDRYSSTRLTCLVLQTMW